MTRIDLIKILLAYCDRSYNDANVEIYSREWFHSNNHSSFRLSEDGFNFLSKELEIKYYEIQFPNNNVITPQLIVFLDRYLTKPWVLIHTGILLFDEQTYFEISLLSDDITKFGITMAISSRQ